MAPSVETAPGRRRILRDPLQPLDHVRHGATPGRHMVRVAGHLPLGLDQLVRDGGEGPRLLEQLVLAPGRRVVFPDDQLVDALLQEGDIRHVHGRPVDIVPVDVEQAAPVHGQVFDTDDPLMTVEIEEDPLPLVEGVAVAIGRIPQRGEQEQAGRTDVIE